jgi:hypothetical protein
MKNVWRIHSVGYDDEWYWAIHSLGRMKNGTGEYILYHSMKNAWKIHALG